MTETTVEQPTETWPEVIPFDDSLTKDQMWQHIREHHIKQYSLTGKTTKDELIRYHKHWHEKETPSTPLNEEIQRNYRRQRLYFPDGHEHIHTALAGGYVKDGVLSLDLDKPLSMSEAKTLTQLVNNDFDALLSEMRQLTADRRNEAVAEVTKEWDSKKDKSEFYRTKGLEVTAHYRTARDALVEKARADGISLTMPSMTADVSAKLDGRQEAIGRAKTEVDTHLQRAEMALHRQRLTAQRQILLATITPDAQKVLDQVPNAKDLMLQAAQEKTAITQ